MNDNKPESVEKPLIAPSLLTEGLGWDGTERLCRVLYGRSPLVADYVGGSNAKMLHDAADRLGQKG